MINLEEVSYYYKKDQMIIENLNLSVKEGEIISIIGKNGAGKSTILNLMAGMINPKKGSVLVDGINTKSKKDFLLIRKKVGIVFQNPENQILFPNVYEDLEFALKNLNLDDHKTRIENALNVVDMGEYIDKDTYDLSLGQKQRINIASILAMNPKYLLFDEPTTMIDSKEKQNIYNCFLRLKKQGYTIVFVTNNVNEILLSDKILVVEDKRY